MISLAEIPNKPSYHRGSGVVFKLFSIMKKTIK